MTSAPGASGHVGVVWEVACIYVVLLSDPNEDKGGGGPKPKKIC